MSATLPPKRTVTLAHLEQRPSPVTDRRARSRAQLGVEPTDVVRRERTVDADPLERLFVRADEPLTIGDGRRERR